MGLFWRLVVGGYWEDVTAGWLTSCTWSLGCMFCPPFPQPELFSRTQPSESNMLLKPSGWYIYDWIQVWPLYKLFKILACGYRDLIVLWLPKTCLVDKFPCLLKLPRPNLERSASFFGPSLPSMYGRQFQISSEKLSTLQTNSTTLWASVYKYWECGGVSALYPIITH